MLSRIALGHATGTPPAAWSTGRTPAGRPVVTQAPPEAEPMQISLAHSGPYLVASTSACGPVAVDLEVIRERRYTGIARYLDWPAHTWANGMEANAFFHLWTLWEAAIKLASARPGIVAAELFANFAGEIDAGRPAQIRVGERIAQSWQCAERFWLSVLAENTAEIRLFHVRSLPPEAHGAEVEDVEMHCGSLAVPRFDHRGTL